MNAAALIPPALSTFGKLGPSAACCLQNLADVACATGFADRGVLVSGLVVFWRIIKQFGVDVQ